MSEVRQLGLGPPLPRGRAHELERVRAPRRLLVPAQAVELVLVSAVAAARQQPEAWQPRAHSEPVEARPPALPLGAEYC